MTSIRTLGII